jgi:GntR family transcriptional regulator
MKRINLSDQVVDEIKARISQGIYHPNDTLPTIVEMAAELGVGRSTIREALSRLAVIGLVEIRQGKGIFVTEPKVEYSSRVISFTETVTELGMVPGTKVLHKEIIHADVDIAQKLQIESDTAVNLLIRLRLADGIPMAVERSCTPYQIFPDLLEMDGLEGSLYRLMEDHHRIMIESATRVVKAVLTQPEENNLLGLTVPQPALQIETIARDVNRCPIEFGTSLYRADRFHFIVQQTRDH